MQNVSNLKYQLNKNDNNNEVNKKEKFRLIIIQAELLKDQTQYLYIHISTIKPN